MLELFLNFKYSQIVCSFEIIVKSSDIVESVYFQCNNLTPLMTYKKQTVNAQLWHWVFSFGVVFAFVCKLNLAAFINTMGALSSIELPQLYFAG